MIQQVRKGDLIEVSFRDHAEGTDHLHFTTWGRVMSQTKLAIVVCGWNYETPTQEIDPHDSNVIVHTILKSTITSMFRLVRKIA